MTFRAKPKFSQTDLNTGRDDSYNEAMATIASQLLALFTSLILALPPGWCAALSAIGEPMHGTRPACCARLSSPTVGRSAHHAAHIPSGSCCPMRMDLRHDAVPEGPFVRCCCVRHALLPETTKIQQDEQSDPFGHLPTLIAWDSLLPSAAIERSGDVMESLDSIHPFYQGPRLHLVKCVWRC